MIRSCTQRLSYSSSSARERNRRTRSTSTSEVENICGIAMPAGCCRPLLLLAALTESSISRGGQRIEARPRDVEILDLEQLSADHLVNPPVDQLHEHGLECTPLGDRAERVA